MKKYRAQIAHMLRDLCATEWAESHKVAKRVTRFEIILANYVFAHINPENIGIERKHWCDKCQCYHVDTLCVGKSGRAYHIQHDSWI